MNPDPEIMLVLGAPNTPEGLLSPMAISRLDTCYALYKRRPGKIMLTGGYGEHFNTTNKPHHWYAAQYLQGKGIAADDLVGGVNSRNTLEDALLSRPLVLSCHASRLIVITSDFHLQRAGSIFCEVYGKALPVQFIPAPSLGLSLAEMQALLLHEQAALEYLQQVQLQ